MSPRDLVDSGLCRGVAGLTATQKCQHQKLYVALLLEPLQLQAVLLRNVGSAGRISTVRQSPEQVDSDPIQSLLIGSEFGLASEDDRVARAARVVDPPRCYFEPFEAGEELLTSRPGEFAGRRAHPHDPFSGVEGGHFLYRAQRRRFCRGGRAFPLIAARTSEPGVPLWVQQVLN